MNYIWRQNIAYIVRVSCVNFTGKKIWLFNSKQSRTKKKSHRYEVIYKRLSINESYQKKKNRSKEILRQKLSYIILGIFKSIFWTDSKAQIRVVTI